MFPPLTAWCSDVFPCWSTMRRSAPCCIILCMMLMLPFLLQRKKSLTHILHQLFDNCGLKIMQISAFTNNMKWISILFWRDSIPASKVKGGLSGITGYIGVCTAVQEEFSYWSIPMKSSKMEGGKSTPTWKEYTFLLSVDYVWYSPQDFILVRATVKQMSNVIWRTLHRIT